MSTNDYTNWLTIDLLNTTDFAEWNNEDDINDIAILQVVKTNDSNYLVLYSQSN